MDNKVIMIFNDKTMNKMTDIEVPLNITANELIYGLTKGFHLSIDLDDISDCYLCTDEPKALIRGDKTLEELGLRNGTIIIYDR